jgi:hypothetical protein
VLWTGLVWFRLGTGEEVMNLRVPKNPGNLPCGCTACGLSSVTQLHRVNYSLWDLCRLLTASILNFKFFTALELQYVVSLLTEPNLGVSLNYLLRKILLYFNNYFKNWEIE